MIKKKYGSDKKIISPKHNVSIKTANYNNLIPNKIEKGLITLNQSIIRKKALGDCQKTLKKIDRVKQEIERFEKKDKPAYERWIQDNFGDIISKIRLWSVEIQEKRAVIDEVQEEAFQKKITFIEAYRIIKYKKEHPEKFPTDDAKEKDEERYSENEADVEEDIFREDLNDFFNRFNEKYNMNEEEFKSFKNRVKTGAKEKSHEVDGRLKERYRLVVQKLHPDKNQNASEMEKELWHEAQEAYKKKDLEKLDFIIALFNIRFGSIGIDSTIFDLKTANSKLEKSFKQFGQAIRRAKQEPSWLFLSLKPIKLTSLKKEASKEFKDFERVTSIELREVNMILSKWEKGISSATKQGYSHNYGKQKQEDDFLNFYANF